MDKNFYWSQIKRLKASYGNNTYSNEIAKAIWDSVSHVSADRFEKAITRCLAVSPKYPPGLDRIEVVLADMREVKHEKEKKQRNENAPSIIEISEAVKKMRENL